MRWGSSLTGETCLMTPASPRVEVLSLSDDISILYHASTLELSMA